MLFTLRDLAIWDIIYEHCGYFVPESLASCFDEAGFQVLDGRHRFVSDVGPMNVAWIAISNAAVDVRFSKAMRSSRSSRHAAMWASMSFAMPGGP